MIRTLATLAATAALSLTAAAAFAAPIVVGHRGANTSTVPENTLQSMQYAAPAVAMLEGDVRWTKDSDDPDSVGTIVLMHDTTLDRTTNCTGAVKDRLWVYIRDRCRTDKAGQKVPKLVDWISYANTINKPLMFDMKLANATNAQAKQFWGYARKAPAGSMVVGTSSVASSTIAKIKAYDKADTSASLRYGYVCSCQPSVSTVKATGSYAVLNFKDVTAAQVATYQTAGLRVVLWTGKTEADYASMVGKKPWAVSVDDAQAYNDWLASR